MKYDLVGIDGNAYAIMGYVRDAMRKEGRSQDEISDYFKRAKSCDYNNLLAVSLDMIEELNKA